MICLKGEFMQIHQDFLMRQIEIIARTLAKLIFDKDTPEYIVLNEDGYSETDLLLSELIKLIDGKKINEAENKLFEYIRGEVELNEANPDMREERKYLEIAIDFYTRLNNLSDKYLEECKFERGEIDEGIRETAEIYNFDIINKIL
jgi:hypothetical protein